jgi:hypothetical protein
MGVFESKEKITTSTTKQFAELEMLKGVLESLSINYEVIYNNSIITLGLSGEYQIVFDICSPGGSYKEVFRRLAFYRDNGIKEFYFYDPDNFELSVFLRTEAGRLEPVEPSDGFVSPLLGITFSASGDDPWTIFRPDGEAFLSYVALMASRNDARDQAARESERAEAEHERAEAERERAERLAARLREAGIDPDAV